MKKSLIPFAAGVLGFAVVLLLLHGPRDGAAQVNSADEGRSRQRFSRDGDAPPGAGPDSGRQKRHTTRTAPVSSGLFVGDAFEGTFLQLTEGHRTWPAAQWRKEFHNLRDIGIHIVIVQWSQHDEADFTAAEAGKSVIENLAEAADEQDVELYVGLSLRKSWGREETFTAKYMAEEFARNEAVADRLYKLLRPHASFCGWYIPHEVTDLDLAPDHQVLTRGFVRKLARYLNRLDALKPVLASGYTDPEQTKLVHLVCWWTQFLKEAGIDILLFQDGAGVARRVKWQNNLPFVQAMALLAAEFEEKEVWLVADTFAQTHGRPVDDQPFAARPADIARLREQLVALSKFERRLIAYSYFDYLRPSAGEDAARLYDGYRKYFQEVSARNSKRPY